MSTIIKGGGSTIADGANVTEGSTTDAAITTNATGTMSGKLRGIVALLAGILQTKIIGADGTTQAPVLTAAPAGTEAGVYVRVVSQPAGGGGGGPADVGATTAASETDAARQKTIASLRLLDTAQAGGSQLVTAKGDQTSGMWVNVKAALPAGTAVIGHVIVDTAPTTAVTGTFWQATQPVSAATLPLPTGSSTAAKQPALGTAGAASVDVITVQGIASGVAQPVSGTFFQGTQPVSLATAPSTPVTGTFWQATQPVSGTVTANAGTGTLAVSLATAPSTPVTGTFWQATQPVSGTVTAAQVTAANLNATVVGPTLTKGTQGPAGFSVQELKDAGRVNIMWTAEFSPVSTPEALLTLTESRDGAATSTFTTKVVTSGKRLRITSVMFSVENTLGASLQRAYLRMRFNTAGAVTTASPQQHVLAAQAAGTVKSISAVAFVDFPDGAEFLGDGTKQIGFTIASPDWVTAASTLKVYVAVFGYEY